MTGIQHLWAFHLLRWDVIDLGLRPHIPRWSAAGWITMREQDD
ncbi:hypothetical protein AB0H98_28300 [Nocardia salmonicida]